MVFQGSFMVSLDFWLVSAPVIGDYFHSGADDKAFLNEGDENVLNH